MDYHRGARALHYLALLALALPLALAGALAAAPRAHAASDSLTLQIQNAIVVQGTCPTFQATLRLAAPLLASENPSITLSVSTVPSFRLAYTSASADRMTYTFVDCVSSATTLIPGNYYAKASFLNPDTHYEVFSSLVEFKVVSSTTTTKCYVNNDNGGGGMLGEGVELDVAASTMSGATPVSKAGDLYTVTFAGPTTYTTPPLPVSSTGLIRTTTPTQYGEYALTCTFLGNNSFKSSSASAGHLKVGEMLKLGAMKLYTNPTTIAVGVPLEFYVVLQPASGHPTPTGTFTITIGGFYSNSISVSSSGATLVKMNSISTLKNASGIIVSYYGDYHYAYDQVTFPLTNPAIPGSGGGGGGGGGGASATPTMTAAAATGTATASVTPAATATTGSGVAMNAGGGAGPSGNNTPLWLIGALGLLVVLGAGAGFGYYMLRRRRQRPVAAPAEMESIEALDH